MPATKNAVTWAIACGPVHYCAGAAAVTTSRLATWVAGVRYLPANADRCPAAVPDIAAPLQLRSRNCGHRWQFGDRSFRVLSHDPVRVTPMWTLTRPKHASAKQLGNAHAQVRHHEQRRCAC